MKIKMVELEATTEELKASRVLGDVFLDTIKSLLEPLTNGQEDDAEEDAEECD